MTKTHSKGRLCGTNPLPALYIAAGILLLTATLKIISSFGRIGLLAQFDPVLGFPRRWIFAGGGIVELAAGVFLLTRCRISTRLACLNWIVSVFVLYQALLALGGFPEPCSCLGKLYEWILALAGHDQFVDWFLLAILVCCALIASGRFHEAAAAQPNLVERIV
jgi:hypothetical protein